jgi:hypothetical protein
MLKLIYLESSIYLEWLDATVKEFVATRKILAVSTGQNILVESGFASILAKVDPAHLAILQLAIACTNSLKSKDVSLCSADRDYLEVSFSGIWISSNLNEVVEGVFVTDLGNYLEDCIYKIWLENQPQLTSLV